MHSEVRTPTPRRTKTTPSVRRPALLESSMFPLTWPNRRWEALPSRWGVRAPTPGPRDRVRSGAGTPRRQKAPSRVLPPSGVHTPAPISRSRRLGQESNNQAMEKRAGGGSFARLLTPTTGEEGAARRSNQTPPAGRGDTRPTPEQRPPDDACLPAQTFAPKWLPSLYDVASPALLPPPPQRAPHLHPMRLVLYRVGLYAGRRVLTGP